MISIFAAVFMIGILLGVTVYCVKELNSADKSIKNKYARKPNSPSNKKKK